VTATARPLDVDAIRAEFPSLRPGRIHLDNPGGTQVHASVPRAIERYLLGENANLGGPFETSEASGRVIADGRAAMARLLGADADEIVFGANMTTLTMHASRALCRELGPGDEVLVTGLDHDANVAPWILAAEDRGATVRFADIDAEACLVDVGDFAAKLSARTRIAAFGWTSNAAGTINDVPHLVALAREAGALTYVDAVHHVPHGPVDVHALGCDFLACSPYKFFGPHSGVLYGRRELLARHRPYKVRPAHDEAPDAWETGTPNLEAIAGITAAAEYLTGIGMDRIAEHEHALTAALVDGLDAIPGVTQYGTRDLSRRVPTVMFTVEGATPADVAAALGDRGIFVWDGNYYALELMTRLGLEEHGGAVRVGAVHYTTPAEIDAFLAAVADVARRRVRA
jgi:cysteine desulfurase family protein (TIGR01976 family)